MRDIEGGWRLGVDPDYAEVPSAAVGAEVPIHSWAIELPKPEPSRRKWVEPSHLEAGVIGPPIENFRQHRIERGILTHRILQLLPEIAAGDRQAFVGRTVKNAGYDGSVAREIMSLVERPELAEIFESNGLSEVPIRANLADLGGSISGRIDRLILREAEIIAVDFKTDRNWPSTAADVKADYLVQMAAYSKSLKAIHPGTIIRCAILWTAAPQLMDLPDILLEQALDHIRVERP
jgi:ATP-dependent helicase/nuclease subunit A